MLYNITQGKKTGFSITEILQSNFKILIILDFWTKPKTVSLGNILAVMQRLYHNDAVFLSNKTLGDCFVIPFFLLKVY